MANPSVECGFDSVSAVLHRAGETPSCCDFLPNLTLSWRSARTPTIKAVTGAGAIKSGFVQLKGGRPVRATGPSVPLTGPSVPLAGPRFPLRGPY